jgi:N-acetylmuramoyl-L-alanine amidase
MRSTGNAFALIFLVAAANPANACERGKFGVYIDVGHSSGAPGATSARGQTEYSFNLRLAGLIEHRLVANGFVRATRVLPSRRESLAGRPMRANELGTALFISIHHDSTQRRYLEKWSFNGTQHDYCDRFRGWSLFVSRRNAHYGQSLAFAEQLAGQLMARGLPFSTHHAEQIPGENRPFADAARGIYRYDGLAVLSLADAPAVLLEAGVIVNRDEELALASAPRQHAIAESVAAAVASVCNAN